MRSTGNSFTTTTLHHPSPLSGDRFGYDLDIDNDWIIAGACLREVMDGFTSITDAGDATVYRRSETDNWQPVANLPNPEPGRDDQFGYAVAINTGTALAGAPLDDSFGKDSGAAYFYNDLDYTAAAGDWLQEKTASGYAYLVFRYALEPGQAYLNRVATNTSFEFKTQYQDAESLAVTDSAPITFSPADGGFFNYGAYGYYVVALKEVSDFYRQELANNAAFFNAASCIPVNKGKLTINYQNINIVPDDIFLIKDLENTLLAYDTGYEDPVDDRLDGIVALHPDLDYDNEERGFRQQGDTSSLTVNFWLRLEDPLPDEVNYKRVLTICGNDEFKPLLHLAYLNTGLNLYEETLKQYYLAEAVGEFLPGSWKMLTVNLDRTTQQLTLYINSEEVIRFPVAGVFFGTGKGLQNGAWRYFGRATGDDYNTGFFSVAQPFDINRGLTSDELARLYLLGDKYTNNKLDMNFSNYSAILTHFKINY